MPLCAVPITAKFSPPERVKEGKDAGAIWNIDPTTGKRKKKARR